MVRHEGDEPISRYDCERCQLKTEVENMKGWLTAVDSRIKTTDGRLWAVLIIAVTNLLGILGAIALLLFQNIPAMAAVGK